ncbi:MAG TPA: nucleotidyltransferase domain-containing protein [Firmicutes bacterium]|nr:nucleotidyltransferase domain-containing protein [Bacillota bacterium]
MQKRYETILNRALEALLKVYGDRLISVVIFGSVGRGTARPDSDIDILVVARDLPPGRLKRMDEFNRVEQLVLPELARLRRLGVETELSAILKTPEEIQRGSLLFLDMTQDAIILYDPQNFMGDFLERLKAKLNQLKARRVFRANAWYWDLKPDYRPGEDIGL